MVLTLRSSELRGSFRSFTITTALLAFACGPTAGADETERTSAGDGVVDSGIGNTLDGGGTTNDSVLQVGDQPLPVGNVVGNPTNCADAAASESYIGCDFWPTVLANPVFVEYDFAVVVANGQAEAATVTINGPNGFSSEVSVAANGLETIRLPWVAELKGPEFDVPNTPNGRLTTSLSMKAGAYHMVSSLPVAAYQFNPLQYQKTKGEGAGKGTDFCGDRLSAYLTTTTECRAASNDASILLPSTAMTGNYVVGAYSRLNEGANWGSVPGGFGITATQDNTQVTVEASKFCFAIDYPSGEGPCILPTPASGGDSQIDVPELEKSGQVTFSMNAGDVVQLVGHYGSDPNVGNADVTGSIVNATAPVQVIGFNAIAQVPDSSVGNADHLEDTILPAEVIGRKYVVVPPTAYGGGSRGHIVRIFGHVDNTQLTFPEGKPEGAPDVLNAGEMVQIPVPKTGTPPPQCNGTTDCYTNIPFVVEGDQPFSVASIMVGGDLQVPGYADQYAAPGDPSMSMMVTPEQFRTDYTFLAPADFMENYADILVPDGAVGILDGQPLPAGTAIGASGWSIVRAQLSGDAGGIHSLTTDDPRGLGLQVMGFGSATSFYYPGGLNLKKISEAPEIIIR